MRKLILLSVFINLGCKAVEYPGIPGSQETSYLVEPVNVIAKAISRDMMGAVVQNQFVMMRVGGCEFPTDGTMKCLPSADKKKDSAEARAVSGMLAQRFEKLGFKVDSAWSPRTCDTYHMVKAAANSRDSTGSDLVFISVSPMRKAGDTASTDITAVTIKHHCPECSVAVYVGSLVWRSGSETNYQLTEKFRGDMQIESDCSK